ncbi:MAG: flagellar filament capping protein FliD [Gallionella sp.]|jgi:flagellar hook-associated protein 2
MSISGIPAYRPYITPDYSPFVTKIIATLDSQTAAILRPVEGLRQASTSYDIKISNYGQIQSDLAVLESAAQTLSGPNAFSRYSAKSTNPAILTSYAQGGAFPGVYNVEVSKLAQGETLVSAAQHDLSLSTGSDQPATVTFQFKNGDNIALNINTSNGLPAIASSINQAHIGISASVISDDSGFRLMLNGSSGSANAFSIGVSGNDAVSHLLSYADGTTDGEMSKTMAAQDSQGSVNGTPINGNSNVLTGIAGGVTLNLKGVGHAAVTVSPDLTQVSNAVQSFVDAYNIAQSDIAANLSGELSGDKTLRVVSGQLSSDLAARQSNGSPNNLLAQIGIALDKDGTLLFNAQAFQDAFAQNPDGVAHLFTDNGHGLADQIATQIHEVIQPSGDIASTIDQLLLKIQKNQQIESNLQDNVFQNLQYSAHEYAQQLAMVIVKQIMDYFLQFTQQQSSLYQTPLSSNNPLPASLISTPSTSTF